jgi:acetyl esterase/lipase
MLTVPYSFEHDEYRELDVSTPAGSNPARLPAVVVIHGGGLREHSKERMAGIVEWVVAQGWVAVNINYRLLSAAAYPAPLEDTLAACLWVFTGPHPERRRVALLGASAGGFLALTAGLILGTRRVRAIVSISGPASPGWYGGDTAETAPRRGRDPRLFLAPTELVGRHAPPVLAVHSRNDKLVPPSESQAIVERMRGAGRKSQLYLFDGPGEQHGIWRNEQEPLHLLPNIEDTIAGFLRKELAWRPRLWQP